MHFWRSIFDAISDPFCLLDLNGQILRCNQAMADFVNKPFSEIIGRYCYEVVHQDSEHIAGCPLARLRITNRRETMPLSLDNRSFIITVDPYRDRSGQLVGAVHTIKEITEQKRLEEELYKHRIQLEELARERTRELIEANRHLKKSEEMYRRIVETANEGIWIVNNNNCTVFVNRKLEEMLGYSAEEMLGRPCTDFINGEWPALFGDNQQSQLPEAASQYETMLRRRDGTSLWGIISVSHLFENGGCIGSLYMVTDITGRKWAENALRSSEERFSKAFNASPIPMLIIKLEDGVIFDVNESLLRFSGYRRDEIIGRALSSMDNLIESEELKQLLRVYLEQGCLKNQELKYRIKSGKVRTGLLSVEQIEVGGKDFALCVINDITELRQLEKEMLRLDRLNLIGEMAAGIGHEIRNPITTVRGFLQMLGEKIEYQEVKEHFALMIEELDRANAIITEFLSLAKDKALDLKQCNLNSIVAALFPLIQSDAMVRDCSVKIEPGIIPDLLLDEKEIRQLILNLTRNGLDAMPAGRTLTISTFISEGTVSLAVRDEGPGIPPSLLERLGTPFLTTKENGTGLGLAICYSIAARHRASIGVETGPNGTTFTVRFPCSHLKPPQI